MKTPETAVTSRRPSAPTDRTPDIDLTAEEPPADDPAAARVREKIAQRFAAGIDDLVAEMWSEIIARIPAYRRSAGDPTKSDELRASIRGIVEIFIGLVRDPAAFTETLPAMKDAAVEIGKVRATQGHVLDDVQQAASLALRVGLRRLRADVRALGVTETSFEVAGEIEEVLHTCVNEFGAAVASGFMQVHQRNADDRVEQRFELVEQILDGKIQGVDAVAAAGVILGHANLAPCTLLVAAPSREYRGASIAGAMAALFAGLDGALRGPVRSEPVPHAAVLVPRDVDVSWAWLLGRIGDVASEAGLVVAAENVPRAPDLPVAYAWVAALVTAPLSSRPVGLVEVDDILLPWIADQTPERFTLPFVRAVLGPALASDWRTRDHLLGMARAFFAADGRIEEGAEQMGVAPRTFQRYLRRFEEVTGRSLRLPRQQALVQQALLLHDLRSASLPEPGSVEWGDGRAPS